MRRTIKAVIGCKKSSAISVNTQGGKVKTGMTLNAAAFPGTATAVATLGTDLGTLVGYISTAKGNSAIKDLRNLLTAKIYGELQSLLANVNTVAAGNIATINLSGFPYSQDPTPQAVPAQVVIKKIAAGVTALSAKITIVSLKQRGVMYTVRTTTVAGAGEHDPSWVTILVTPSSKKLIVPSLVHNQEVYISVNASNTHGIGVFSDPMAFSA